MPKNAKPAITLTPEQIALVEQFYYLPVRELLQKVFNDPQLTLRNDPEVKAIKLALANIGKQPTPMPTNKEQDMLSLLDEAAKEYVRNNHQDSHPLEMARILFANPKLEQFSREVQAVTLFCKQLDPKLIRDEAFADNEPYLPPKSIMHLVGKVNKWALNTRGDGRALFDPASLTNAQTHQLEALMAYMRLPLFKVEADKFVKRIDREVFESTFIANCWDKPDLGAAHVIQFIQLSSLIVKGNQLDRIAQKLDDRQTENLSDPGAPIKMAEVETLNAYREKINVGAKQIKDLIKTLEGERATIIKGKMAGNASMHNLVMAWKREEDRKQLIQLAERKQKAALRTEVERFSNMESLKGELFGINRDDILL